MSLSIYEVTVPAFIRGFTNLAAILAKAEAHAKATGLDPKTFLEARLAPDMAPLTAQVQRASDIAKGCMVRLSVIENVSLPDTETSFPELKTRIDATVGLLRPISAKQLEGAEDRRVDFKMRDRPVSLDGRSFVIDFVLPNFYFHVTTAYGLLRHKGLEIGKTDYLGAL
ncbi:MAG: DUF1993 domain-containing protein [Methylocella sp.]